MKKGSIDVVMVTYNQEKHIANAIESVILQDKWADCKLIIGDDCSTDGTLLVCKGYAEKFPDNIILLESDVNRGLINNYLNCFNYCTSDYIAILEGDDYWTDKFKLNKQIKVLENDTEVGLVHTSYETLNDVNNVLTAVPEKIFTKMSEFKGYIYNDIVNQNFICSVTVMFRRKILNQIDFKIFEKNNCNTIDLIIYLQCAITYKIDFLTDVTSVYRVSPYSLSNNVNFKKIQNFSDTKIFIKAYFLKQYNPDRISFSMINRKANVFLFYKALISKDLSNSCKYLKKLSLQGIFGCFSDWKIYN